MNSRSSVDAIEICRNGIWMTPRAPLNPPSLVHSSLSSKSKMRLARGFLALMFIDSYVTTMHEASHAQARPIAAELLLDDSDVVEQILSAIPTDLAPLFAPPTWSTSSTTSGDDPTKTKTPLPSPSPTPIPLVERRKLDPFPRAAASFSPHHTTCLVVPLTRTAAAAVSLAAASGGITEDFLILAA